MTLKTEGPVNDRSARLARLLWLVTCLLGVIVSLETWYVRPDIVRGAIDKPFVWLGLFLIACSAVALASGLETARAILANR